MSKLNASYAKKLQTIAYTFLKICTNNSPTTGKRLNKNYWQIYNFLYKTENIQPKIQALYEYALELEEKNPGNAKQLMSLTEFIQNAEKWRIHLVKQAEKAKINELKEKSKVSVYKEFSLADLENL